MFRRMYGTRHRLPVHRLTPMEHAPWLQATSELPLVLRWCCGAMGMLVVLVALIALAPLPGPPHPLGGLLVLLSLLTGVVVLYCLIVCVGVLCCRDRSQYCPDCLSYMTRGANVCPFCGFRPEGATPSTPPRRPYAKAPHVRSRAS